MQKVKRKWQICLSHLHVKRPVLIILSKLEILVFAVWQVKLGAKTICILDFQHMIIRFLFLKFHFDAKTVFSLSSLY
jgi:hypothetical protein